MNESARKLIITSVGTLKYALTEYSLNGKSFASEFAPAALANLRALEGYHCLLVATRKSLECNADLFVEQMAKQNVMTEVLEIPPGKDEKELIEIVSLLMERIPRQSSVILEVTNALRHLPFVYLAALSYLVGLQDVSIEGIYYGAFEMKEGTSPAPIIDVTSLFNLIEWYHALQKAKETGDLRGVSNQLSAEKKRLFHAGVPAGDLGPVSSGTRDLSVALAAGLPIETGLAVSKLTASVDTYLNAPVGSPAVKLAVGSLRETMAQWSSNGDCIVQGLKKKQDFTLSSQELDRQLALCEWYAEKQDFPKVLQIAREWLVSYTFLNAAAPGGWLDHKYRMPVERKLGALAYRNEQKLVQDPTLTSLGKIWDKISQLRNNYAHAGMTTNVVGVTREQLASLLSECRNLLSTEVRFGQSTGSGTWLVTPLGLSPGVLYSALTHVKPNGVLVVTSTEAEIRIEEALSRSACEDIQSVTYKMKDPFYGFSEASEILSAEMMVSLLASEEVVVNITGGTTAMQYVVERLADKCRRIGIKVRTIALVDKRPVEQQRNDPWQRGEVYELDGRERVAVS